MICSRCRCTLDTTVVALVSPRKPKVCLDCAADLRDEDKVLRPHLKVEVETRELPPRVALEDGMMVSADEAFPPPERITENLHMDGLSLAVAYRLPSGAYAVKTWLVRDGKAHIGRDTWAFDTAREGRAWGADSWPMWQGIPPSPYDSDKIAWLWI